MKLKLLLLLLGLGYTQGYTQPIKAYKVISENKIVSFTNQKLILVDFWATWCVPCVPATQQLEVLQKSNADKVFVISISDEPVTKIQNYLYKHPINLMVLADNEQQTFTTYNITKRPFAILFTTKGDILWKGHPSDITSAMLQQFHSQQNNVSNFNLNDFIDIGNLSIEPLQLNSNLVIEEVPLETSFLEHTKQQVIYQGKLKKLIETLKNIYPYQLKYNNTLNKNVKIVAQKELWNFKKELLLQEILNHFQLKIETSQKRFSLLELLVNNEALLWDQNQFTWADNPVNYLIGSDRIMADNVSLQTIAQILSEANNQPYFYSGNNTNLYDWDFQYLYPNLMTEELENGFGLMIQPVEKILEVYTVQ